MSTSGRLAMVWNNVYSPTGTFVYAHTSFENCHRRLGRGRLALLSLAVLGLPLLLEALPFSIPSRSTANALTYILELAAPKPLDLRDILCGGDDLFDTFFDHTTHSLDVTDDTIQCRPGDLCPCHQLPDFGLQPAHCMPVNSTLDPIILDSFKPKAFCATTSSSVKPNAPCDATSSSATGNSSEQLVDEHAQTRKNLKPYKTFLNLACVFSHRSHKL